MRGARRGDRRADFRGGHRGRTGRGRPAWDGFEALETRIAPALTVTIDYSLDTNNFFDTQPKRDLLQRAADTLAGRFDDALGAIAPGGSNTWTANFLHPATGASMGVTNRSIAANEIVVFAGGRDLGANTLGVGGPGGFSVSGTTSFVSAVRARGQAGVTASPPTDFARWGGSVTFTTNPGIRWHFGDSTTGLDFNEFDFFSVALHEVSHLLGFGTAASWSALVSGTGFTGAAARAAYDGATDVPLAPDTGHWADGTTDDGFPTAMDPTLSNGKRVFLTKLDFAGLDDLGWDVAPPAIAIAPAAGLQTTEAGGTATFTVALTRRPQADVTIALATSDATEGSLAVASLTFTPANWNAPQAVTVTGLDDATSDGSVAYAIITAPAVSADPTYKGLDPPDVALTNSDDDVGVTLSVSGSPLAEAAGQAVVTARLSSASARDVTVVLGFGGTATPTADYTRSGTAITIPAGQLSGSITLTATQDSLDEANETIVVDIDSVINGAESGTQQITAIITDDDSPPPLLIADVAVSEGNGGTTTATFTVTLAAASGQTITVIAATANGTAVAPGDYTSAAATLTFAPGQTAQTFSVAVVGDTIDEPNETFLVNLSGATNATIADAQGIATIVDDDAAPALLIGDVTVTEGNSGTTAATFTVSLSAASGQTITVTAATANGTAVAPGDYTSAAATLTFAPGQTAQTFTVAVVGDAIDEPNETFLVNLSGAGNATIADAQGVGTITDDDPAFGAVIDDGGLGYSQAGPWVTVGGNPTSFGTTYRYVEAGDGSARATWQFNALAPGSYDVQVSWTAASNRATNAPYRIYDGPTLLRTVRVDQRPAPSGAAGGGAFLSLGILTIATGPLRVELGNDADSYVIADAVRALPATPPAAVDDGQAGYSQVGAWTTVPDNPTAFGPTYRYAAAGTGEAVATWQLDALPPGSYDVQVSWTAAFNRASDAPYRIYDGTTLVRTVRLDQRLVPSGTLVGGAAFQSLGVVTLAGGATLRVELANDANNYVIADAARAVAVATPAPLDDGQPGYSQVGPWVTATGNPTSFGTTYRYAAAGTGAEIAAWQFAVAAPGSVDVLVTWTAAFNRATNAPYRIYDGATLLRTVRVDQRQTPSGPSIGGTAFQRLAIVPVGAGPLRVELGNDADNYVIADAVRVTAAAPPEAVDDGQAGYRQAGPWTNVGDAPASYGATYRYAPAGTGSATASWQLDVPAAGRYDVMVSWTAAFNRASNAPYRIFQGTTLLATVRVDQRQAPAGPIVGGVPFQSLGLVTASGGEPLRVVLGNDADNYVIADAARAVAFVPPPALDDGQPGYSQVGPWVTVSIDPASYGTTYRYAAAGTGSATATWQTDVLDAGSYEVQVTWTAAFNRASNAPYRIYQGTTLLGTVRVDQRLFPSGATVGGAAFQSLGVFALTGSGALRVVLGNDADNYVIADAVRVVPVSAAQASSQAAAASRDATAPSAPARASLVDAALAQWPDARRHLAPSAALGRSGVSTSLATASPGPRRGHLLDWDPWDRDGSD